MLGNDRNVSATNMSIFEDISVEHGEKPSYLVGSGRFPLSKRCVNEN